jgi:transposase
VNYGYAGEILKSRNFSGWRKTYNKAEGLSYRKIGKKLGISEGMVRMGLKRF